MSVQSVRAPTRSALPPWLLVALAGLAALAAFGNALLELVRRWIAQEEYSHGFFIPLIAAWLLWSRRDALIRSMGRPEWLGLALVLLAGGMLIIGELSAIFILAQLGFIIALLGVVLAAGGYPLFKVTLIPIVFLIFAIPLPYFIDSSLSWRLQLLSSELGVAFIRLFQIPVYLEGNIIDLGNYKLQVIEACSGLRYLYPLLSLGFLAAYMFQAPFWKRALVFLSAIPITIAMNSLRIGIVGMSVNYWGTQMAEGVLHFFEGWIIFLACAGLLAAEIYLLARLKPHESFFDVFHLPEIRATEPQFIAGTGYGRLPLLACLIVLAATGTAAYQVSHRHEIVPERHRFAEFPAQLGGWTGRQSQLEPQVEHFLGLDDYVLSNYTRAGGSAVNLYVAYYRSQRGNASPHSPEVCIPGGGWQITSLEHRAYTNPQTRINLPYNRVVIERNSVKQIVYYWFDQRGRKIANEYLSKWYLLKDSILRNRTDGALVRLTTALAPNESELDADKRLQAFMIELAPQLKGFLPS